MALNFERDLNRPITHFDNVWGQWCGVAAGYALAIASIGSVAIPWEHQAQKTLRVILPIAGMVCNIGASWKVRELDLMHPYRQDRAIARRDVGATMTAAQAMPYLENPTPKPTPPALMPAPNPTPQNSGLYDWNRILWEAVGIIIAGNSGAGKTSVACFLLGLLTQSEPKKIIVCDPHFNKIWRQTGLTSIGRIPEIEQKLTDYVAEMDRRYDALADGQEEFEPMIIVLDELGKCQSKFENPSFIEKAIARLGCEGRKVGMTAIIICHSQNVEDMGISKKLRNNYVLILLRASALDHAELRWKTGDEKRLFVESQAYPCIVSGSVRDCPALHPTHHQYQQYKIQGNQPLNLLPINQIHGGDRPTFPRTTTAPSPHHAPDLHQQRTTLESLLGLECTNAPQAEMMVVHCPKCASPRIRTNGKRGDKTRYRCNDCGSSWSE